LPRLFFEVAGVRRAAVVATIACLTVVHAATATTGQDLIWEALTQRAEKAKEPTNAIPLAEQALALAKSAFGPRDARTLRSMHDLAAALAREDRDAEAEAMYRETLNLRREVLGERHPDTLASMSGLAEALFTLGRLKEAEAFCRNALQLRTQVLGSRHPPS
jgi:hypothetical protein